MLQSKNVSIFKHLLTRGKSTFVSAVYPTAYNSHSNSNGNTPQRNPQQQQMQRQQLFKTTIPINEQQQQQQREHCQCQQTAGTALNTSTTTSNNNKQHNNDVTSTQSQHPLCFCALPSNNNNNNSTTTNIALRSSHANKNHTTIPTTTTTTTTTTIEYELSNGIAKLTKISTSRNGNAEQSPLVSAPQPATGATEIILSGNEQVPTTIESNSSITSSCSNLPPLLTTKDLALVQANLQALNLYNLQQQQRANYSTMGDKDNVLTLNACKRDRIGVPCTGSNGIPNTVSGYEQLKNKKYTKGKAFTISERQRLGIHGLMPAAVRTIDEQVCCILQQLDLMSGDFERYLFLQELSERNEHLFYRVLATNITKMIPLVYTPTVGEACQKFSLFYHHNKGLFISIKDKGHVYDVIKNWPERDVRAIVVTDGERILGLGDLGANGMGIPIGKLQLYTTLGGIPPSQLLPVTLDVGTNTKALLDDPFYIGLKQKRVTGVVYDEFIDEFMFACRRRFGQHCLIQFEDFGNSNAFRLLEKYRDNFCTFNDDIQGTASVALGGLFTSLKMTQKRLLDNKILFFGAGEAALGIANLCVIAMVNEGLTEEEAISRIFLIDSRGLIVCNRPTGGLNEHKLKFAHRMEPIDTLEEAVKILKPSVLIGASAIPGSFNKEILKSMAENNDTPIIFALSNPTSKAECTAEAAYTYTQGRAIFASGSPFAPVQYGNKTLHPGMGNNAYIFPGVALGVLCAGMETIPEEVFLIAAKQLSDLISTDDLERGSLYPQLKELRCVSMVIAKRVMSYAYEKGLATLQPEPQDKMEFIKSQMYELDYLPAFPEVFGYGQPESKL